MCPDIEDGSEVVMEEVVQLLPSLLQLSASLVVDGQLITSIAGISSQHMSFMLRECGAQTEYIRSVFPLFQNYFQRAYLFSFRCINSL